jgi:hypothetical protein
MPGIVLSIVKLFPVTEVILNDDKELGLLYDDAPAPTNVKVTLIDDPELNVIPLAIVIFCDMFNIVVPIPLPVPKVKTHPGNTVKLLQTPFVVLEPIVTLPVPLELSKIASSLSVGTPAPPAPPEVKDQLVVNTVFQFPGPPTQ